MAEKGEVTAVAGAVPCLAASAGLRAKMSLTILMHLLRSSQSYRAL